MAGPSRDLPQEMRHLGPVLASSWLSRVSLPGCEGDSQRNPVKLLGAGMSEHPKCFKSPLTKHPDPLRTPAELPGLSGHKQGRWQRVGSSLVCCQKKDLSGTQTTEERERRERENRGKKEKDAKNHHPGQNDKWKAGSSEHQIVQTMEKKTTAKLQHLQIYAIKTLR